jgi:serine/threonine protein kinase
MVNQNILILRPKFNIFWAIFIRLFLTFNTSGPQYIIEKVIGEGGFGITYKARHQDLNFPVVIKTPNSRLCRDVNYPRFVEGFGKEGRTLAKISQNHHPNIVRIIDFFEEDNLPCLVMDFLKGENLYHLIQDQGILSESTAIDYIKQIADALSICHQNGIIHRDAHPGNMILRENSNTVILIDFGLAGNVNSQSINQTGNRAFAPWEQMVEIEKAPSIDVYTLAASLFYLLTGYTPTASLERKLSNRALIQPKQLNSKIGDKLNQAIIKGLELEPRNRPQSMEKWVALFPNPSSGNNGNDVELKSAIGMDYSKLRDLLKAGNWKEADKETLQLILCVGEREEEGWLRIEDIDNFPCDEIRTIDHLWVKYSNGQFPACIWILIFKVMSSFEFINVGWDIFSLIENCYPNQKSNIQNNNLIELDDIELISAVGMNYRKLRYLLVKGKWKEADKETVRVMLAVAKRDKEGDLDVNSIDNFPCEDLRTIDQLWVKYSHGKFGFSVQKRIYQDLGGTRNYDVKIWQAFGDKVEWRKGDKWLYYNDVTFDIKAPEGHLPVWLSGVGLVGGLRLFFHVETCKLFLVEERQPQIIPTPQPVNQEVQLKSSCGMDYSRLRDLLKAGNWKEADKETVRVMLAVAKREKEGWLDIHSIDNFPCEDLRIIDKLWLKHSDGKFGFSVQERIYQSLGGTSSYDEKIWQAFGNKVEWRKEGNWLYYNGITFDKKSPEGYLPVGYLGTGRFSGLICKGFVFFSRVETCRLFPVQERQAEIIPTPEPVNQEVQLQSSCGMDYSELRDLLKAGNWKEADEETRRVMLAVAKREKEGWLRVEDIDNFPCVDLHTIDQLWVKYSDGKFGFSLQKRIYKGLGGTRQYNEEIWEMFGEKVGWKNEEGNWLYYRETTFNIKAPEGHLPRSIKRTYFAVACGVRLFSRVETCKL